MPTVFEIENLFDDLLGSANGTYYYTTYSTDDKKVVNSVVDCELPYNLVKNEDSSITFSVALAGVAKDLVDIEREGRKLTITIKGVKDESKTVFLMKKIKLPSEEDLTIHFTPTEKYDVEKSKASIEDGLLTIIVPLKEDEKPTKVKID